ncbi:macrophage-expressed gene 1 protein [Sorex fumeus]|uniref:macrophage-expressed gene 1 protein n=1 Tax=Sorex fumeus TaxID=62283 RepID=UPI0024ADD8C2|nr:macrophage-expressed gene 1 protein [Sorex fumeus]XP_055995132.1 macrophage-expressed gene 1 protein [Sorex fumeus]XP_055995137.1 macrophage-expressed gene 1 protein [Sorex fumeus]
MHGFRGSILCWALAAWAIVGTSLEETDQEGFQQCKDSLNLSILEVLPGGGWDNLRNVEVGRVMNLTYTNCRTTEDGQYIIPDEIFTIPQKQSNLDMNSEILESWINYQSSTSNSINLELSLFSKVNGKFSFEFQRMKTLQVRDQAITTRVQVRNLIYTVKLKPASGLNWRFKNELLGISERLESNQTRMANYLAELLVLNYGTHVITSVDAGAALIQEDHIRSSFLQDSQISAITASAGIAFQNIVNFKAEDKYVSQNAFTKSYLSNRTNSRVQSIGGLPFYPGITLQTWQEGITNHLVAIDRAGLPLHSFINCDLLPELPGPLVKKLSKTVEAAVRRYYNFNTYPGCTDVNSPNFNFQANTDDGSCEGKMTNFSFGGVYQECTQFSGNDVVQLCQNLLQKNPLTGDFSCPSGYSPVHLLSQTHEEGLNQLECYRKCTLRIFCKTVCEDVFQVAKATFKAFWCVATGSVPENSGLLFGGLYSEKSINPLTNAQSCPAGYFPLALFESLKVCVSQDYELGSKFSVPFGGFFSCVIGNPLVTQATSKDSGAPSPKKCPGGFSQHLALISDGCQVSYCVKAGLFTGGALHPARLPPYTQPPLMNQAATNTVLVMNPEAANAWIKDSKTNLWRLGEPLELRRAITSFQEDGSGLSGGAAVGVSIGVTTGLAAAIALAIYTARNYKKKDYQEIKEERESLTVSPVAAQDSPEREQEKSPV